MRRLLRLAVLALILPAASCSSGFWSLGEPTNPRCNSVGQFGVWLYGGPSRTDLPGPRTEHQDVARAVNQALVQARGDAAQRDWRPEPATGGGTPTLSVLAGMNAAQKAQARKNDFIRGRTMHYIQQGRNSDRVVEVLTSEAQYCR